MAGDRHGRSRSPAQTNGSQRNLRPIFVSLGLLQDVRSLIRARNESVPIVVLSSRGDEAGKVRRSTSAPTIT
jgi:hypothetical protein